MCGALPATPQLQLLRWEELSYPHYSLNEPSSDLPMKIFEVPPCFGKRPTTWSIEVHDSSTLSIVITSVYSYRDRFDAMGVPGGRIGATDTSKGDYVRIMKNVDVSQEGEVQRIMEVLDDVLKSLALRVFLSGSFDEKDTESPVSKILATFRKRPHMHFVSAA